jgi:antagonist of KipI
MGFKIIKPGLAAKWQGKGKTGLGHLGVGLGGPMDWFAAKLANVLVGNHPYAPVFEMHFPAPVIEFMEDCMIGLTGGDFGAQANGLNIPVNRRVFIPKGTQMVFPRKHWGNRAYLSISSLGQSTQLFQNEAISQSAKGEISVAKWFINPKGFYKEGPIKVLAGPEWDWLSNVAQKDILSGSYTITNQSNRMGYQLQGHELTKSRQEELMSSGVLPGTVQLLPNGQPLLLMADCQTTGGYPRILQVVEADLPRLAQMGAGESFVFEIVDFEEALHTLNTINHYISSILYYKYV